MPRSAREIDLDPRAYVGLSFPLRADNNNNFAMTKNSIQQSKHNLRNLLLTYPGERAGNPEFGCRLREVCFEPSTENLPSKIQSIIVEAVNQFLPYINIVDVETLTEPNQQEKIFVSNKFCKLYRACCNEFIVNVKLLLISALSGKDNPTKVLGSKSISLALLDIF